MGGVIFIRNRPSENVRNAASYQAGLCERVYIVESLDILLERNRNAFVHFLMSYNLLFKNNTNIIYLSVLWIKYFAGEDGSGKTTLMAKLQGAEHNKKGRGLEYLYLSVHDEDRDGEIHWWTLNVVSVINLQEPL